MCVCVLWFVDRKNCENVEGKPDDIGYNAASFVWCPDIGTKVCQNGKLFTFWSVITLQTECVSVFFLYCPPGILDCVSFQLPEHRVFVPEGCQGNSPPSCR